MTNYSDHGVLHHGTLLPCKASGHTFNQDDTQPVSWDNLELRIDARTHSEAGTRALGIHVGASHALHGDVAELISIDNGTVAESQYTHEYGVTISMQDSSGPFDWHLTRRLLELCATEDIAHARDVFPFYRSDDAAAPEADNDIRTALVCFGLDASHGHERVHLDSLDALARLLISYMTSPPLFQRDRKPLGPLADFPPAEVQTPDWQEKLPEAPPA